jgi:hypothetical protein
MNISAETRDIVIIIGYSNRPDPDKISRTSKNLPVIIGRKDGTFEPDISIHDPRVSRQHAKLWHEGQKWMIEDLGSKHGTFLGERNIKNAGPVEYEPGTPVCTGDTIWTAIPQQWLYIQKDHVIVMGPCVSMVNYAMYHCGTSLIGQWSNKGVSLADLGRPEEVIASHDKALANNPQDINTFLTAWNMGQRPSMPMKIRLEVQQYSDPCLVEVPPLAPGIRIDIKVPPIRLHVELLQAMSSVQETYLKVGVNNVNCPQFCKKLRVLGLRYWSFDAAARPTIGAFVNPSAAPMERIVNAAETLLRQSSEAAKFDQVLRSGREDGERLCIEMLYRCLADCNIQYEPKPQTRELYQRIRTDDEIVPSGDGVLGVANCLDLSVLFAGAMERIGLLPIVLLLGKREYDMTHALAGCLVSPTPGPYPVLDDAARIRHEVASNHLIVFEATGVTKGLCEHKKILSFSEAQEEAKKWLEDTPWICAIDIGALRQRFGRITPMEHPYTTEVMQAIHEADKLARSKHWKVVETVHLFYGILVAGDNSISSLFKQVGCDVEELRGKLMEILPDGRFQGHPQRTRNFSACLRQASEWAWSSGNSYIHIRDLIMALSQQSPQSRNFSTTCEDMQIDIHKLGQILKEKYPYDNDSQNQSISFSSGPQE